MAAALTLVLGAGCGEAEPLTLAQYAARADAICRDTTATREDLEPPVPEDPVDEGISPR